MFSLSMLFQTNLAQKKTCKHLLNNLNFFENRELFNIQKNLCINFQIIGFILKSINTFSVSLGENQPRFAYTIFNDYFILNITGADIWMYDLLEGYRRSINPFLANNLILDPLKTPENFDFMVFSGGIKWEHWPEMG